MRSLFAAAVVVVAVAAVEVLFIVVVAFVVIGIDVVAFNAVLDLVSMVLGDGTLMLLLLVLLDREDDVLDSVLFIVPVVVV